MEMNEESLKAWDIIEKTSANLFLVPICFLQVRRVQERQPS